MVQLEDSATKESSLMMEKKIYEFITDIDLNTKREFD
jgi:hypothetical protein